jgi:diguanylate cyclase (GGDEF)-like protein
MTRRGFFGDVERRFAAARAEDRQCTVAFADVDGLKSANDSLGHQAGSALIRDAARLLVEAMGPKAVVGRLGGDEFAAYIDGAADPEELRARLTALCDQENADRIDRPKVSISLGAITAWAQAAESLDRVLAAADMCMYLDKRNRSKRDPRDSGTIRRAPREPA